MMLNVFIIVAGGHYFVRGCTSARYYVRETFILRFRTRGSRDLANLPCACHDKVISLIYLCTALFIGVQVTLLPTLG